MTQQKDFKFYRFNNLNPSGIEIQAFEYQLYQRGRMVKSILSNMPFNFGIVNISDKIHIEMHINSDSVPAMDMEDQNTFIVPVIF